MGGILYQRDLRSMHPHFVPEWRIFTDGVQHMHCDGAWPASLDGEKEETRTRARCRCFCICSGRGQLSITRQVVTDGLILW